jgi:hypothetical protein
MIRRPASIAAFAACFALTAVFVACPSAGAQHVTDGSFTSSVEWATPTTASVFFPRVGVTGGAWLYADQGFSGFGGAGLDSPDTLFLMYDYVDPPAFGPGAFFDVFFEVPTDADYLVRINGRGFNAFERPHGSPAPLGPDGSFDIGPGSGWQPLSSIDLDLAQFQAAQGFGPSPNLGTPHPMAEFQLSINNDAPGRTGGEGLYDPAPAFWSASKGGASDPPISSAIFQLNPDGSTIITPIFGPSGGPVQRPQDVVPEPSMAGLLAGAGVMGTLLRLRKRRA